MNWDLGAGHSRASGYLGRAQRLSQVGSKRQSQEHSWNGKPSRQSHRTAHLKNLGKGEQTRHEATGQECWAQSQVQTGEGRRQN